MQDPGWAAAWPAVVAFGAKDNERVLVQLRGVFLAFVAALLLIAPVTFLIVGESRPERTGVWAGVLCVLGALSIVAVLLLRARRIDEAVRGEAVARYRQFFFWKVAAAEYPAIIGFAIALVTQSAWLYLLALVFALIAMALSAPTKRDIERQPLVVQQALWEPTP